MIKDKRLLKRAQGYQCMVAGREKMVVDMTHDELVREVINTMNLMEKLDVATERQGRLIEGWRRGKE